MSVGRVCMCVCVSERRRLLHEGKGVTGCVCVCQPREKRRRHSVALVYYTTLRVPLFSLYNNNTTSLHLVRRKVDINKNFPIVFFSLWKNC